MRSLLRPVANPCIKSSCYGQVAALVGARAPFEKAADASQVFTKLFVCKKSNVVELAFSEVGEGPVLGSEAGPRFGTSGGQTVVGKRRESAR